MRLSFHCESCDAVLSAEKAKAGQPVKCHKCGAMVRIPTVDEPDDYEVELPVPIPKMESTVPSYLATSYHPEDSLPQPYRPATFKQRWAATSIDTLIVLSIELVALGFYWLVLLFLGKNLPRVLATVGQAFDDLNDGVASFIALLLVFLLLGTPAWLYSALFESSRWQGTPPMAWLGIKVVDMQGQRITFGRATRRFFTGRRPSRYLPRDYWDHHFCPEGQTRREALTGTLVVQR